MSKELKPCPFCGTPAVWEPTVYERFNRVHCVSKECAVRPSGPIKDTKKAAAAAWNRRPTATLIGG
jgi:Lar family restriction alleviation protein